MTTHPVYPCVHPYFIFQGSLSFQLLCISIGASPAPVASSIHRSSPLVWVCGTFTLHLELAYS